MRLCIHSFHSSTAVSWPIPSHPDLRHPLFFSLNVYFMTSCLPRRWLPSLYHRTLSSPSPSFSSFLSMRICIWCCPVHSFSSFSLSSAIASFFPSYLPIPFFFSLPLSLVIHFMPSFQLSLPSFLYKHIIINK